MRAGWLSACTNNQRHLSDNVVHLTLFQSICIFPTLRSLFAGRRSCTTFSRTALSSDGNINRSNKSLYIFQVTRLFACSLRKLFETWTFFLQVAREVRARPQVQPRRLRRHSVRFRRAPGGRQLSGRWPADRRFGRSCGGGRGAVCDQAAPKPVQLAREAGAQESQGGESTSETLRCYSFPPKTSGFVKACVGSRELSMQRGKLKNP